MRAIDKTKPDNPINKGVVVFHAGSNIVSRWTDFQKFSHADQAYYQELLELECIPINSNDSNAKDTKELIPNLYDTNTMEVKSQSDVSIRVLKLIEDPKAIEALEYLESQGVKGDIDTLLESIPTTKVQRRQAKRQALSERVRNSVGRIIRRLSLNPEGTTLDKSFREKNYSYIIAKINSAINQHVGKSSGERPELNIHELEQIEKSYYQILEAVEAELRESI